MRLCFLLEPLEPRITLSAGFIASAGLPGGAVPVPLHYLSPYYPPLFALQPDGRIIVAGYQENGAPICDNDWYGFAGRAFLFRLNRDGSGDSTFGDDGITNVDCFPEGFVQLVSQADGKL